MERHARSYDGCGDSPPVHQRMAMSMTRSLPESGGLAEQSLDDEEPQPAKHTQPT